MIHTWFICFFFFKKTAQGLTWYLYVFWILIVCICREAILKIRDAETRCRVGNEPKFWQPTSIYHVRAEGTSPKTTVPHILLKQRIPKKGHLLPASSSPSWRTGKGPSSRKILPEDRKTNLKRKKEHWTQGAQQKNVEPSQWWPLLLTHTNYCWEGAISTREF